MILVEHYEKLEDAGHLELASALDFLERNVDPSDSWKFFDDLEKDSIDELMEIYLSHCEDCDVPPFFTFEMLEEEVTEMYRKQFLED